MLALIVSLTLGAPPVVHEFEFDGPGDGRKYAARLTVPAEHTGAAVLLTGGGTAFDEHWTTPGSIESEGHPVPVTIDGQDTRDADTLAAAFAERGLIVMQWSLIHTADSMEGGTLRDPLTYGQGMPIARAALATLRARPEVNADRIILVGHSLGATRSFQMCDRGVIGVVSLAGAYLDRSLVAPHTIADEVWATLSGADANADNALDAAEFKTAEAAGEAIGATFEAIDRDDDGAARPWELAASRWITRIGAGDDPRDSSPEMRKGLPWPVDVIAAHPQMPVLLVAGGLDGLSFHAAMIESRRLPNVAVKYVAHVGHMLGQEEKYRFGPIKPDVVEVVANWAKDLAREAAEIRAKGASLADSGQP